MSPALRRGRPELRVALLATGSLILATALITALLQWRLAVYRAQRAHATVAATGQIIEDGLGRDHDLIHVRWTDQAGDDHVGSFSTDDTGRYHHGGTYPLTYDPRHPSHAFAADQDETAREDNLIVPSILSGLGALVIALWWSGRGLWFLAATRRPARPMTAVIYTGDRSDIPVSGGPGRWVRLSEPGVPLASPAARWQRVMWNPKADELPAGTTVTVHGDPARWPRVVVELPDGTRLVPLSRTRGKLSRKLIVHEIGAAGSGLAATVNTPGSLAGVGLPPHAQAVPAPHPTGVTWPSAVAASSAGATPRPSRARRAGLFALGGAVLGTGAGTLAAAGESSGSGIVVAALFGTIQIAALFVHRWAVAGGAPSTP
ncbi:DUF3592 domain-containing protein [Pseudofrankia asymbiotica]|uniref:DUF3592 domain-containing protein n=1 Tax=Pseudofrankia asymbiotica TaxID=1834516 RepID=A0A1V2I7E3_9ACTN|nr:DUF3592 domain-containing protein [Pseudofrankia asymbiotica]ONH27323.1 hypothetical protein BL253_22515 [Pseudofrankia asymbiotica]